MQNKEYNATYNLLKILFWISIVTIPLAIVYRVEIGPLKFSVYYLAILAMCFVILLNGFKLQFRLLRDPAFVIALLLIALVFALGMYNKLIEVSLAIPFILFYSGYIFSTRFYDRFYYNFPRYLFSFAVMLSIIGIILFILRIPLYDPEYAGSERYFEIGATGLFRAVSLFTNPNNLGYFLVYVLTVLIVQRRYNLIPKRSYRLKFLLFFVTLLLTTSRSSFISILLIFFMLWLYKFRNMIKIKAWIKRAVYSFIIIMITVILYPSFYENLDPRRIGGWQAAFILLKENLQYVYWGFPSDFNIAIEGVGGFSDNLFIYILIKAGLFGLLAWSILLIINYSRSVNLLIQKKIDNIKFAHSVFMLSTIVPIVFSNYISFYPMSFIMGISSGIIYSKKTALKQYPLEAKQIQENK